jgi:hypothetical protein
MLSFEREKMSPADRAAANEEWADYFEYRLAHERRPDLDATTRMIADETVAELDSTAP